MSDILMGALPCAGAELPERHRQGEELHAAHPLCQGGVAHNAAVARAVPGRAGAPGRRAQSSPSTTTSWRRWAPPGWPWNEHAEGRDHPFHGSTPWRRPSAPRRAASGRSRRWRPARAPRAGPPVPALGHTAIAHPRLAGLWTWAPSAPTWSWWTRRSAWWRGGICPPQGGRSRRCAAGWRGGRRGGDTVRGGGGGVHRLRPLSHRALRGRRRDPQRDHGPGPGRRRHSIPTWTRLRDRRAGQQVHPPRPWAVVDFAMNNACAAGTGSFLEEQAARLDISIEGEFQALALSAPAPACLGERCTVFMESDLIHHQQRGRQGGEPHRRARLLHRPQLHNRVVNTRPVGRGSSSQGGVAHNAAVGLRPSRPALGALHHGAAPPRRDGAIGVALLAARSLRGHPERAPRFRGFDATGRDYGSRSFVCKACPTCARSRMVNHRGRRPSLRTRRAASALEEGGPQRGRRHRARSPTSSPERERLLLGSWMEPGEARGGAHPHRDPPLPWRSTTCSPGGGRSSAIWGWTWCSPARPTRRSSASPAQTAAAETCYPVKLGFGHVAELLGKDVDFVFLPSILDREDLGPGQVRNHYCPYIPAATHMITAHLRLEGKQVRLSQSSPSTCSNPWHAAASWACWPASWA